jgi:RNA polymerase sigma-70 factor (ECF subfamily)
MNEAAEQSIRERAASGDTEGATTIALETYGPEIYRFLFGLTGSEAAASETFSLFAEGVWKGLPRFLWNCTFRTWAYAIARRSSLRQRRDAGRRAKRQVPLSQALSRIEQGVRTRTLTAVQAERQSVLAEIRSALPEKDRALLLLRIDQGLDWNDIARAFLKDDAPEPAALQRESARLRKRFQHLKEKLVEEAKKAGLMDS